MDDESNIEYVPIDPRIQSQVDAAFARKSRPMTTGHERQKGYWRSPLADVLFYMMGIVCIAAVFNNMCLRTEITALKKELAYWRCDREPEQPGSPTPIEEADHPSIEAEIAAAMPMIAAGAVGSPVQDLRAEYASQYRKAHRIKVAEIGHCEGCGKPQAVVEAEGGHLETHHEISLKRIFDEGLDHSLIYDTANFCVFCRECHRRFGHPLGWDKSNPNVRRDAARNLRKTQVAP